MKVLAATAVALGLIAGVAPAQAAPPVSQPGGATITRTDQSIPHVVADDLGGMAYGVGYAQAEDNICLLAEMWTTLAAERSLHFGPEGADSDLYNAYINETAPFERMLNTPPPNGPSADAFAILDGYVAGYNAYLDHVGVDNIPDARCRGQAWVRKIERLDVMRRLYELVGYGGRDLVRDGMLAAEPPPQGAATAGGAPIDRPTEY